MSLLTDDDIILYLSKIFQRRLNFDGLSIVSLDLVNRSYFFEVRSSETIHSGRIDVSGDLFCDCFGFVAHQTICRHLLYAFYMIGKEKGIDVVKQLVKNHFMGERSKEAYLCQK
jgi:hypothetical protein